MNDLTQGKLTEAVKFARQIMISFFNFKTLLICKENALFFAYCLTFVKKIDKSLHIALHL